MKAEKWANSGGAALRWANAVGLALEISTSFARRHFRGENDVRY
jgi:hypothetical protein